MFSGKLKTHKKIEGKWNRAKERKGADDSDDSDVGPDVPNEFKSKNLGAQVKVLTKEEELER